MKSGFHRGMLDRQFWIVTSLFVISLSLLYIAILCSSILIAELGDVGLLLWILNDSWYGPLTRRIQRRG